MRFQRRWVVALVLSSVLAFSGCSFVGADGRGAAEGSRHVTDHPSPPTTTCDTVTSNLSMPDGMGSPADEATPPDTDRLQSALDRCAQSGDSVVAIHLTGAGSHRDFLSGPLTLRQGEVLMVDPGVVLYASLNPSDYQAAGGGTCGTVSGDGKGCRAFIEVRAPNTGIESELVAGGARGRIDGRGGDQILGETLSWWDLAEEARSHNLPNVPRLIDANAADRFTLADVTLANAAGYHFYYKNGDDLSVWGVRIDTPGSARNTDGIDLDGVQNASVVDSWISAGDDGIAVKATSKPSRGITVHGNHLFGTHGISIGAVTTAGVDHVLVTDNTISGRDASGNRSDASIGIRIKSAAQFGGEVRAITYRNTCIDAVSHPIVIDPDYLRKTGDHPPVFSDIRIEGLKATDSPATATSQLKGLDRNRPLTLRISDTTVDAAAVQTRDALIKARNVTFDGKPLASLGGLVAEGADAQPHLPSCSFPAFPAG